MGVGDGRGFISNRSIRRDGRDSGCPSKERVKNRDEGGCIVIMNNISVITSNSPHPLHHSKAIPINVIIS